MTFRVGQKVVCVEPSRSLSSWSGDHDAVVGEVYTVRDIFPARNGKEMVIVVDEIINPIWRDGKECAFYATRFRPAVERKTDISFAHEILRKATKPARSPAIALHNCR